MAAITSAKHGMSRLVALKSGAQIEVTFEADAKDTVKKVTGRQA